MDFVVMIYKVDSQSYYHVSRSGYSSADLCYFVVVIALHSHLQGPVFEEEEENMHQTCLLTLFKYLTLAKLPLSKQYGLRQCTMHLTLHSFSLKLCSATIDLNR